MKKISCSVAVLGILLLVVGLFGAYSYDGEEVINTENNDFFARRGFMKILTITSLLRKKKLAEVLWNF